MDGYTIGPIMFDEAEVNALVTAEQLIAKTNDESLIKNFKGTLTKIKSVFKSSLQLKGEYLENKMLVVNTKREEARTDSLSSIQMAIVNFNVTEIRYVAESKENTIRKIEPSAIYCFNERWIVIAWCRLRQDYRSFRLDRIQRFSVLEEKFEDRKFDLKEYFLSCPEFDDNL